jgi:protein-disulfide isomerase
MKRKQHLILATLGLALAGFGSVAAWQMQQKAPELQMTEQVAALSIGHNSSMEIVLIEDFQCRNCMAFSHQILPKIRAQYVETGKASFTLIPVGFLAGNQVIANAALEVKRQAPERLFAFLEAVLDEYEGGDLRMQDLIRLARRLGGIDLAKLQRCMENQCHKEELTRNLRWAQNLMGMKFKTPALYINGQSGSTYSFEAIEYQIGEMGRNLPQ